MKKNLIIILIVFLFFGIILVFLKEDTHNNDEMVVEEQTRINEPKNREMSPNQDKMNNLLKHIGFAEEALSKFNIATAEHGVDLWIQGIISGNGVLQYAVMDERLQEEFKLYLQHKENLSWNTRSEDKIIEGYEIVEYTEVSEKIKIFQVRFDYVDSQGIKSEAFNKLTLVEENDRWVLSAIR